MKATLGPCTYEIEKHCFCTVNTAGEINCCRCKITMRNSAMIMAADIMRDIHDQVENEEASNAISK